MLLLLAELGLMKDTQQEHLLIVGAIILELIKSFLINGYYH